MSQLLISGSRLGSVEVGLDKPVRIMGVLNLSPESFYRGSVALDPDEAYKRAVDMVEKGADIIDVGGMSTAPYKETYVPPDIEISRVKPVIKELSSSLEVPISIDTRRAKVAEEALKSGASIVNDTSGLRSDESMARIVADHGASLILMAYGPVDKKRDPIVNIRRLLRESLEKAIDEGVEPGKIVLDPGIGFFRDTGMDWYDWDSYVLRNLNRLVILGKPILVGVSRKSFIGAILNQKDPAERLIGSLAAEAIAVYNGASAIRTHNVAETIQAVRLAEYIRPKIKVLKTDNGLVLTDLDTILGSVDLEELMISMDVDPRGAEIMGGKGEFKVIYVAGIPKILGIIIKQEMLALGGECATTSDTIFSGFQPTSILLMGTRKHLNILIDKLRGMDLKSIEKRGLPNASDLADALIKLVEHFPA